MTKSAKSTLSCLLFICFLLINGCAGQPPQVKSALNTEPEKTRDYPSAALNDFIADLFDILNTQNESRYSALWDVNEFTERAVGKMDITTYRIHLVRQTLVKEPGVFAQISNASLSIFKDSQLTLLETDSEIPQIKICISRNDENLYIALVLSPQDGSYKIVDVLDYSMGSYQSQKTATFFENYFSADGQGKITSQIISEAMQALESNNPLAAVSLLESLPESLLSKKMVLTTYLTTSSLDEKQSIKALELLEKYYSDDPLVSYMMAQLYLLRNQNNKAIEALKIFAGIIGPAPELHLIIAELYLAQDDVDNAIFHADKALRIDPNTDTAYWMLAKALSRKNELDDALLALKVLESYFGYEFKTEHFSEYKEFESLYQLADFQTWVKQLPQ